MIKYVVQHKLTEAFCIAFRITCLSEERKYLKEKYNFCASGYDVGKFVIIDEETGRHFVTPEQGFNRCYSVIERIPIYPWIPFKSTDNRPKLNAFSSGSVHDWLRKELGSIAYIDTDNLDRTSMHPNLFHDFSLCQTKDAPWPVFTHIDIRKLEKEKNDMNTKTKTINFCVNKVIFNGPATVVIWGDGTKTVVKCADGDSYSKWAGFAMCIAKRLYGDDFHRQFRHWCGVEDDIPKKNAGDCASVSEAASFACDAFETFGKNASECIDNITKAFNGGGKTADYRDVIFKDTFEAGLVLKNMRNIIDTLGFVSVADCCHLVGALIHFGDHDIGWTDISKAMIVPAKNGYLIKYPEPSSRTRPSECMKNPKTDEFKFIDIRYRTSSAAYYVKNSLYEFIRNDGYVTVNNYYRASALMTETPIRPYESTKADEYGWERGVMINVCQHDGEYFISFSEKPKKLNHEQPNEAKGLD